MKKTINKYTINPDINLKKLAKAGFVEGGTDERIPSPKLTFETTIDTMKLKIEICIEDIKNIMLEEKVNIRLIDMDQSNFQQKEVLYQSFYDESDIAYAQTVISLYNDTMDSLVKKKVLEKVIEK